MKPSSAVPAGLAVDHQLDGAGGPAGAEQVDLHRGVALGHRHGRLDDRVIAERVVVEHQTLVLDEHRQPGVGGAGGPDHPLVAGGPGDGGHQIPGAATGAGRGLGRDRRHRRPVAVATVGGVGGAVVEPGGEQLQHAIVEGEHPVALGLGEPQARSARPASRGGPGPGRRTRKDRPTGRTAPTGRRRRHHPGCAWPPPSTRCRPARPPGPGSRTCSKYWSRLVAGAVGPRPGSRRTSGRSPGAAP